MDQPALGVVSGDSSDVNGDDGIQNSDLVVNRSYKPYFAFMAVVVPWIPQMIPSAIRTYPVRMTTFLVSLCVNFVAFMLRLMLLPFMTQFTASFFSGTLLFTGILSPCALLSIFLSDWLSLLGLAFIFVITIMIVASDLVRSIYNWLYRKVELVIVRMLGKLRERTVSTGQATLSTGQATVQATLSTGQATLSTRQATGDEDDNDSPV